MNTNPNQTHVSIETSWQIPPLGCASAEPVPQWLVDLWLADTVRFNRFGGLNIVETMKNAGATLYPEDWVHVMSDGSIQSCPTDAAL